MSKNGLRSFSGPFDWYISDFPSVLNMIENNFTDFLNKSNLEIDQNNPKFFNDNKYGFSYRHDVKNDFEDEYPLIADRYKRRIEKFMSAVKNPTCFFRAVRSASEVKYIEENKSYIDRIIKLSNPENSIIYLLLNEMPAPENEIYFYLNIPRYVGKQYEMLTMFDHSKYLLHFCANLINAHSQKDNLNFFKSHLSQNRKAGLLLHDINIKKKLSIIFKNKDLYVWGAGKYGVEVEHILSEAGIKIMGFLDNSPEKAGTYINNIKVCKFEDMETINTIFIDIASPEASNLVTDQILSKKPDVEIYTWTSLWDLFPLF